MSRDARALRACDLAVFVEAMGFFGKYRAYPWNIPLKAHRLIIGSNSG